MEKEAMIYHHVFHEWMHRLQDCLGKESQYERTSEAPFASLLSKQLGLEFDDFDTGAGLDFAYVSRFAWGTRLYRSYRLISSDVRGDR